ncbi:MAG: hypothetical protein IPP71_17620 [Bacteroidetes bacterium]|nr:hypothetical protein [Bacteroidota bacterium]
MQQRLLSREEFINSVDLVKVSPSSRKVSTILTRQNDVLNSTGSEQKSAIMISDFQESMADLKDVKQDSTVAVSLVPVMATGLSNAFVDSVWFSSPVVQLNQPIELNVRIRNNGDLDLEAVPVKLIINELQKAVAAADIVSGNYTDVKLTFTASSVGWQRAVVSIIDNPITFDDHFYFSFNVAEFAKILAINTDAPSPYLKALFNPNDFLNWQVPMKNKLIIRCFHKIKLLY